MSIPVIAHPLGFAGQSGDANTPAPPPLAIFRPAHGIHGYGFALSDEQALMFYTGQQGTPVTAYFYGPSSAQLTVDFPPGWVVIGGVVGTPWE